MSGLPSDASNRFKKPNRLLNAAAFGRVFEKATRSRDGLFTVLWRRNDEDLARLGLAISKKLCRRATARNRIKRIVRESFRQHQTLLAGLDVVVINRAAAAGADNPAMATSLNRHWQRCATACRKNESDNKHAGKLTDG
ncbi:MAG: ribonuclease P protein component [Proteobacteria bacterium]|nr:ribonuclease P protein component [Pseudomonadota bacterium]